MPLTEGEDFAGFTIIRLLGAGGMGEVYLAQHPRLPRKEALKILPPDVCADPEYRERFYRETELASTLWHPHIVAVHDCGEHNGQLWISMDYVEGLDADRLLHQTSEAGLPRPRVVEIVTAVADALDYAHGKGLLHRSVKPSNILISDTASSTGRILLSDFGIARSGSLTASAMTADAISYAAPEQLVDGPADGRADQYSLAATAYHLLTGTPLFHHTNPAVVISRHLNTPSPALGGNRLGLADLDATFVRALAKDPAHRFASCTDFAAALSTVSDLSNATDIPVVFGSWPPTPPPEPPPIVVKPQPAAAAAPPKVGPTPKPKRSGSRRRSRLSWAGSVLIVLVFPGLVLVGHLIGRSDPPVATPPSAAAPPTQLPAGTTLPPELPAPPPATSASRPVFAKDPVRLPFDDLHLPEGLALDSSGNLYVGDWDTTGGRLLRLAAGSSMPTMLPVTELEGICALTVDRQGTVYALDDCSNAGSRLLKIPAGAARPVELNPKLPAGGKDIAMDSAGNLYIVCSNRFGGWVVKLAPGATEPTSVPHDGVAWPEAIAIDSADNVYIAGNPDPAVAGPTHVIKLSADSATPEPLPFTTLTDDMASKIAVDDAGTVYVVDFRYDDATSTGSSKVHMLPINATQSTVLSFGDMLHQSQGIAVDASGVYIASDSGTTGTNGYVLLLRRSE